MMRNILAGVLLLAVGGTASAQSCVTGGVCPSVAQGATAAPTLGTVASPGVSPNFARQDAVLYNGRRGFVLTTDSNGNWTTGTLTTPMKSSAPVVQVNALDTSTQPIVCNVTSESASVVSGKCQYAATTALATGTPSGMTVFVNVTEPVQ